jgi:polar amino acid transport system substrate-binding protein
MPTYEMLLLETSRRRTMKWVRCLFAAFIAAGALLSHVARAQDKTVSFVTDQEKDGGFLLEITKEAFKRVGYTVKVEYQPWNRALAGVMEGTSEALLGAQRTDERAAKMEYSDVIGQSSMVFFALKKSNITYTGLESLKPYSIGVTGNNTITPEFQAATYLKKEEVPDLLTNVRKLLAGRVQLIVEKRSVVIDALRTKFPESADTVVALEPPVKTIQFYNAFSKKWPNHEQAAKDFNRGLDLISKDGTLKSILGKGLHE